MPRSKTRQDEIRSLLGDKDIVGIAVGLNICFIFIPIFLEVTESDSSVK